MDAFPADRELAEFLAGALAGVVLFGVLLRLVLVRDLALLALAVLLGWILWEGGVPGLLDAGRRLAATVRAHVWFAQGLALGKLLTLLLVGLRRRPPAAPF